jgi:dihydroorotate dehydrogenase (fumarate)
VGGFSTMKDTTMNLSTRYLGLELESPLVLGASPLVGDLDAVRRAEDAGASAIVMRSLFAEQIAEAGRDEYVPVERSEFAFGPDEYLKRVGVLKSALRVPVIGSINCSSGKDWVRYATLIDRAGADALELNIYRVSSDPELSSAAIEDETVSMVRSVVEATAIPVAVKLSPFYTSLPNLAHRIVGAGAKGLVLFNRFYQPDIDVERLEVAPRIQYSTSAELPLRLRWLAILSAQLETSFAVTGGVRSPEDALKAVLAGADAVQLVSEVIQHGFVSFTKIRRWLSQWLEQRDYRAISQVRDSMNHARVLNPLAYERANYLHVLHSYPVVRDSERPTIQEHASVSPAVSGSEGGS